MANPLPGDRAIAPAHPPPRRDLARLTALLSATNQDKRLRAIGELGKWLRIAPADQRSRIVVRLCTFIRARAPASAARTIFSTPDEDVQAALNVLAARPEAENLDGAESQVDLCDTDLTGAWLASGSFRGARFDRSSLRMVDLSYACLEGASFRDTDLSAATLAHGKLAGADFSGARLDETDVTGAGIAAIGVEARGQGGLWKQSGRAA